MTNTSEWVGNINSSGFTDFEPCASLRSTASKIVLYLFIIAVITSTVVGNFLLVLAIAYFKQLHSPTNSFVLSLAIADFLVGLTVMPYSMIRTIEGCWYFGSIFCRIHSSLDVMLCTASIFHLSCIAFDRYYAVCNPLVYGFKMSKWRVTVLIVICWIVPLLISFAPIMLGLPEIGIENQLPNNVCYFLVNQVYAVTASFVAFYLPMFIMLVAYWKIYKVARRQAMQINAVEKQMNLQSSDPGAPKKPRHKSSLKREKKAAKTLGIIIGAFLVFWLPFFMTNIIDPFIEHQTDMVFWEVFLWLGYVNSSMNPFLYGFFNRSFRRAFFIIISCKICVPGSSPNTDLSNTKGNERTTKTSHHN
ncbi:5-hydroxytryptamine receptor 4-like [Huso huso]|uniref:5-hydroxytryptamine receptor 4 n=1 Tax=Huso huso TaxID=61971 RepID=A0ABR1A9C7_HUSHU